MKCYRINKYLAILMVMALPHFALASNQGSIAVLVTLVFAPVIWLMSLIISLIYAIKIPDKRSKALAVVTMLCCVLLPVSCAVFLKDAPEFDGTMIAIIFLYHLPVFMAIGGKIFRKNPPKIGQ